MGINNEDLLKLLPIFISIVALIVSIISLFWRMILERAKRKAKLEIWLRYTYFVGTSDDRTKILLLFRNLSSRPSSIIDVYLRKSRGIILGGTGYHDRINLPIQIEPWRVSRIDFRIEKEDERVMKDIFVRDIDNHIIIINLVKDKESGWIKK